jgi:hypothetical protein
MKKILVLLVAMATIGTVYGQKVINDANAEKRSVGSFSSIHVSSGIDLYLSSGDEAVAVSASETKYRDNIKTEVKNGKLSIWYEDNKTLKLHTENRRMKAYVSYKAINALTASGGSDVKVEGTIKGNDLELALSGGSDFEGKVDVSDLKVNASGGSDVDISGTTKKLDVDASGGSDVKGFDLSADVCNLEASGGSDITITVNKELSARASGGSDVHYKGNGTVREMNSSGSSSIKKSGK